jgi:organic radical activating enzyme
MSKIKVAELFYSLQGEGKYVGSPSVFLRTFGCNFSCSGFGMPKGEKSNERDSVASNIQLYKHYNDLPLVHTGCDSYASWDPRFKHLSPVIETD